MNSLGFRGFHPAFDRLVHWDAKKLLRPVG